MFFTCVLPYCTEIVQNRTAFIFVLHPQITRSRLTLCQFVLICAALLIRQQYYV